MLGIERQSLSVIAFDVVAVWEAWHLRRTTILIGWCVCRARAQAAVQFIYSFFLWKPFSRNKHLNTCVKAFTLFMWNLTIWVNHPSALWWCIQIINQWFLRILAQRAVTVNRNTVKTLLKTQPSQAFLSEVMKVLYVSNNQGLIYWTTIAGMNRVLKSVLRNAERQGSGQCFEPRSKVYCGCAFWRFVRFLKAATGVEL